MNQTEFVRQTTTVPEGSGAEIKRLFPLPGFMNYDPFVLMDHFALQKGTGFPPHPHRGFEAITYLFEGSMSHADNLGNESTVVTGGAQCFTAGHGIVHSEMPSDTGKTNGIQLWINLPRLLKNMDPEYQQINADELPVRRISGGTIRSIAGEESPLALQTPVRFLDITMTAGHELEQTAIGPDRGFAYVVEGSLDIGDTIVPAGSAWFTQDVSAIEITAQSDCRFIVCTGLPHNQPIYQHGSFVD